MRGVFLGAVIVGILAGSIIAAVRTLDAPGSDGPEPTATPEVPTPRSVAEAFAGAWMAGNTSGMFELLDFESQRTYPLVTFADIYRSFATELTLASLQASVDGVDNAHASLAVRVATGYFGVLEYSVSLNLVDSPEGPRLRWDPSAVHPEMAGGRTFKSQIERPVRGAIYDRNGAALAITLDIPMIGLDRSAITDRAAVTTALVTFGFTQEQVNAALLSPLADYQRVAVGPIGFDRVEAAADLTRTSGIILYFETRRVHPLGPSAAHVVGYTREYTAEEIANRPGEGIRPGDRVGAVGLESALEAVLAGRTGSELRLVDSSGATVSTVSKTDFLQGQSVTTTLDSNVLTAAQARLGARHGAAVVIDPVTNAILALNSSPSFDPDAFERNDSVALAAILGAEGSPQANRATDGLYSAGSTFKLFTAAAGLLHGGYSPGDRLECSAIWYGVDPPRRNWEGARGMLTIAEGLMRSCNPVFYQIALTLYNNTDGALSAVARSFGFGAPTGVVGLAEEGGLVPDAAWKRENRGEDWYPGDEVNLGIGQGDLLITPLQLANGYSTFLARDLRAPVILSTEKAVSRGAIPLTDAQWNHLAYGLQLVTGPNGTASAAFANAGYTNFGGKSGTAEDSGEQQHVLFVAYAPASAPRAVAAVVLDDGQSGSIEAGPIARDIVLAAIP
ncbi:MAG TPA: penicillin-binding transpeptidase domain-containing protein [Tepidiformaceae bacterium]